MLSYDKPICLNKNIHTYHIEAEKQRGAEVPGGWELTTKEAQAQQPAAGEREERREISGNPPADIAAGLPAGLPADMPADMIEQERINIILQEGQSVAAELITYSMTSDATITAYHLYVRKELPAFYFTQAANETGVPPAAYRCWRTNGHPPHSFQNERKLLLMAEILLRVKLRVHRTPLNETYGEAMERFRARVEELKNKNITHNKIAQYLRMSNRTLIDVAAQNSENKHRPSHCPWEMLVRLMDAERRINTQAQPRTEDFRNVRGDRNIEPVPPPPPDLQFIYENENCRKCGATWTHMYYDGMDAYGNLIYTCMTCSRHNLIRNPLDERNDDAPLPIGEGPPREEFIQRYGECRSCDTPGTTCTGTGPTGGATS